MASSQIVEATRHEPLRVWPGVVIVVIQWLGRFVLPAVAPEAMYYGVIGGVLGGLALLVWWVFFSRARWSERLGALALMAVVLFATSRLVHVSVATGMMGMMFPVYVIPTLSLGFVAWAVVSHRFTGGLRRATLVAALVLACGLWALVRTGGFTADLDHDFAWRWSQTSEERLIAKGDDEPRALPPRSATEAPPLPPLPQAQPGDAKSSSASAAVSPTLGRPAATQDVEAPGEVPATREAGNKGANWPSFRGPNRDGVLRGVRINTDWTAAPPVELWRRAVGPGWSSFAVDGDLFYTQEQRGDDEIVSCYRVSTGEPVWRHRDSARFWESNGGPGPRGTPTLSHGRVYSFGATGILNVLDARDGSVVWSRNAASDSGATLPDWGFSSSPLVVGDMVMVATSGILVAYDLATGKPRWAGPKGAAGYSSPHLLTIDGTTQILQLSGTGAIGVGPEDGAVLWEHPWKGYPIVQPALTEDGDVLIAVGDSSGIRRLSIAHGALGWSATELWTSLGLKPYFNDFVVHQGHAYGFDGSILACIDLKDGKRKWKGGRYGNGQLILLPDQDVLLVLSEQGELALVGAAPDRFTELARFKAIEGKTWNHPVVSGDVLLVRNGEEMVAFRVSLAG
jgi:outer membrane protein assembly factor BamB